MDKEKQFGTIGALWFIMNSYVEIGTTSSTFKKTFGKCGRLVKKGLGSQRLEHYILF